ncbi:MULTISPECIES: hypothetical protein [unclassified Vibrio]|uniref:hypothetical protein n=1 Tax=unclassified Vibrio TaxID=2614977 RepID=UPI000B8E35B6|nr:MULTISPECIES: hypothetical protein [unclassified Vibrio]NAW91731.1 hypothetical protein [Vibrio sp. V24_P1S3T111]OXX19155.1 hypothetical protein B9J86_16245 [Vibrio sp. V06_P1A73T115]OXX24933.1 hypothetical protein B9J88_04680 [Vibrio sp. V05_P4A8T149]OXX36271.1 hypothetical protein B9J81_06255 [Vibrio sp. V04_P4A5T148]OXX55090.1 hypothetical protein B9J91_10065 [Vibrio sp. V18_P1S4T112]
MTNQKKDSNRTPAKIGKVLLSKDGEEFFTIDGVHCVADTVDPFAEDYPDSSTSYACFVADKAILNMCRNTSKTDKSKQ